MKWFILTDLEGACRINRWAQCSFNEYDLPQRAAARRYLTAEINAAVAGLCQADSEADILVWDGHGDGGIDGDLLSPNVSFIARGSHMEPPYGLTAEHAGLLIIGQHAMAGTPQATLAHTYSSKSVEWYKLNGQPMGELGCRAVMAGALGERGVPVVLVSGDDKATAEARALMPKVLTVDTKQSLGTECAVHRPPAVVHRELTGAAAEAVGRVASIEPVRWTPPFTLTARLYPGCSVEWYLKYPGTRQLDERTVELVVDDLSQTWI